MREYAPVWQLAAVTRTRSIRQKDMVHNAAMPAVEIELEPDDVRADASLLTRGRTMPLLMTQSHFLF